MEKNKYNVLSTGIVLNNKNNMEPQRPMENGYMSYGDNFYVHRAVALKFIPNINNYSQVNHIDGNKHNNNVENLEWCSPSQNIQHAYDTGLRKKRTGFVAHNIVIEKCDIEFMRTSKLNNRELAKKFNVTPTTISRYRSVISEVMQYSIDGEYIATYKNATVCGKLNGFSPSHISSCCRGERKQHKGFIFKIVEKDYLSLEDELDSITSEKSMDIGFGKIDVKKMLLTCLETISVKKEKGANKEYRLILCSLLKFLSTRTENLDNYMEDVWYHDWHFLNDEEYVISNETYNYAVIISKDGNSFLDGFKK